MVSFFGLKLGADKKKKSERSPEPRTLKKKIDQNLLGEGQFFGTTLDQPVLINGSRPGTANSNRNPVASFAHPNAPSLAGVGSSPYGSRPSTAMSNKNFVANFRHPNAPYLNGGASSMVDLGAHGGKGSIRPMGSETKLNMGWNNSSMTNLNATPTLPVITTSDRPGTSNSNSQNKWVHPLDVHFHRNGTPSPAPTSTNGGPQSPAPTPSLAPTAALSVANAPRSPLGQFEFNLNSGGHTKDDDLAPAPLSPAKGYPSPPPSINGSLPPLKTELRPNTAADGIRGAHRPGPTSLPSPTASTERSSEEEHDFPRPIIQNVTAKRDTLTFNAPRRQSFSMAIDEDRTGLKVASSAEQTSHYEPASPPPRSALRPSPLELRIPPQPQPHALALARAKAQAQEQERLQAQAEAEAEAEAQAKEEAEAREKEEAEIRAKEEAEAQARAEAKAQAEAHARAEAETYARAQNQGQLPWNSGHAAPRPRQTPYNGSVRGQARPSDEPSSPRDRMGFDTRERTNFEPRERDYPDARQRPSDQREMQNSDPRERFTPRSDKGPLPPGYLGPPPSSRRVAPGQGERSYGITPANRRQPPPPVQMQHDGFNLKLRQQEYHQQQQQQQQQHHQPQQHHQLQQHQPRQHHHQPQQYQPQQHHQQQQYHQPQQHHEPQQYQPQQYHQPQQHHEPQQQQYRCYPQHHHHQQQQQQQPYQQQQYQQMEWDGRDREVPHNNFAMISPQVQPPSQPTTPKGLIIEASADANWPLPSPLASPTFGTGRRPYTPSDKSEGQLIPDFPPKPVDPRRDQGELEYGRDRRRPDFGLRAPAGIADDFRVGFI